MAVDPIAQTLCPVPLGLTAIRGDSLTVVVRLYNRATGAPIPLTGYSGEASIYVSQSSSVASQTIPVDVDQSPAGGATTGIVTLELAGQVSTTWIEDGAWALVLDNGTVRKTIIAGPWKLRPVSQFGPAQICGLNPLPGSGGCGGAVAIVGDQCEVTTEGYTRITLPYPSSCCAC